MKLKKADQKETITDPGMQRKEITIKSKSRKNFLLGCEAFRKCKNRVGTMPCGRESPQIAKGRKILMNLMNLQNPKIHIFIYLESDPMIFFLKVI